LLSVYCCVLGRVKDGSLMVMKRFLKDDGFKILTFPVFFFSFLCRFAKEER